VATGSPERLFDGDRRALSLVMVAGRPSFGESPLVAALDPRAAPVRLEGEPRRLEAGLARRAAALLRAPGAARQAAWATAFEADVGA
jgi:hypothetical protein